MAIPVKSRAKTPKRGKPTPEEKQAARIHCRNRARGRCEWRVSPACTGNAILPLDGPLGVRGELCHAKGKRRWGWMENEAVGQRHIWGCAACHRWIHNGGKPVPPK